MDTMRELVVYWVTGLPGTGKTTLARLLAARLGWAYLSVSETMRKIAQRDAIVAEALRRGFPVPPHLVVRELQLRIHNHHRPVVIDGFPQTVAHIDAYARIVGAPPAAVVYMDLHAALVFENAASNAITRTAPRPATTMISCALDEIVKRQYCPVYVMPCDLGADRAFRVLMRKLDTGFYSDG